MLRQFDSLKQKHPDAMLLFRKGDFYEMYKEDAVKAATILAITLTSRTFPGEKAIVKYTLFPHHALDVYLPKLIRSGQRVAICDQLETPILKKEEQTDQKAGEKSKVKEEIIPNNTDMAKRKKDQAVQDKPVQAATNTVQEKPVRQKYAEQKTEAKVDTKVEQQAEAKKERKPREPQMVTADGGKVTHGHAYQGKDNPEEWYFTAKIDSQQLKPQKMDAADLAAYQKKDNRTATDGALLSDKADAESAGGHLQIPPADGGCERFRRHREVQCLQGEGRAAPRLRQVQVLCPSG